MRVVERAGELGQLREAFASCASGKGQVVLVRGATATGKTSLVHIFSEWVTDTGARFLEGAGERSTTLIPFGLVTHLLNSPELADERSEDLLRMLRYDLLGNGDDRPPGELPITFLHRFWTLLNELAAERPLVIAIDDVQYADDRSRQILLSCLRRMRSSRTMVILTETPPAPSSPFNAEIHRIPWCHHITLAPLTVGGLTELLATRLSPGSARRLAADGHRATGGSPGLASALLRDTARGGPDPMRLVFGEAFDQAVLSCLYGCRASTGALARAIAVLGQDAAGTAAAELAGLDQESADQGIRELAGTGLLADGWYRHAAARNAVLNSMTGDERATLHRRAAEILHAHGAPGRVITRHLVAAGGVAPQWAVPVLQDAAERALADDEADAAVNALKLAYQACRDDRRRATITALLTRAEWRTDPALASRHLPELERALAAGQLAQPHACMAVTYLIWHGRRAAAGAALDRLSRGPLDTDSMTRLHAQRLAMASIYPDSMSRKHRDEILASVRRIPALPRFSPPKAIAVLARVLARGADDDALAGARQMLRGTALADDTAMMIVAMMAAMVWADDLDRAEPLCQLMLTEATSRHARSWQALFAGIMAAIKVHRGEFGEAERHGHAALGLIGPQGWGVAVGSPLASLVLAAVARGDHDAAARHLSVAVPEAMFETPYGVRYIDARGTYYLATGWHHAALADFQTCGELLHRWHMDDAGVPWRVRAAEAYLDIGEPAKARDLLKRRLDPGTSINARVRGAALRVLAATEPAKNRPALLREAVALHQEAGDQYELARALADLSRAQHALGRYGLAGILASSAALLAKRCGAEALRHALLAEVEAGELVFTDQRPIATDSLTELSRAERRVAELAAWGFTNREIASRLHVTVSTVEQHLTHVYQKLNVTRAGLVLALRLDVARPGFHDPTAAPRTTRNIEELPASRHAHAERLERS